MDLLDKVVPENSGGILKNAYEYAHLRCLVLNRGARVSILNAEQLPKFTKARETPVALLGNEAMVRVCHKHMRRSGFGTAYATYG